MYLIMETFGTLQGKRKGKILAGDEARFTLRSEQKTIPIAVKRENEEKNGKKYTQHNCINVFCTTHHPLHITDTYSGCCYTAFASLKMLSALFKNLD